MSGVLPKPLMRFEGIAMLDTSLLNRVAMRKTSAISDRATEEKISEGDCFLQGHTVLHRLPDSLADFRVSI